MMQKWNLNFLFPVAYLYDCKIAEDEYQIK